MIPLLHSLLRIPSTSDNISACREVLETICDYLGQGVIGEHNDKPYLIVRNYDFEDTHADIILNGHVDVVPLSETGQFEPYEQDGKLYARGSGDMKGGDVIIVEVMKQLIQEGYRDKKIMLMLTSDEEIGGFDGVEYLVKQGYTAPLVLIPDSGSLTEVITGEKGILTFEITTHGKEGHSSRPWKCDNAIERLYGFYKELQTIIQENEKLIAPDYRSSTVQITKINAGKTDNVIPGEAFATINIRHTERFTIQTLKTIIDDTAKKHYTTVRYGMYGSLLHTSKTHPTVQQYLHIANSIIGKSVTAKAEHGASDGRFFAEQGSVVLLHRPTCANIHGKDERVQITDIQKLIMIYYTFITTSHPHV